MFTKTILAFAGAASAAAIMPRQADSHCCFNLNAAGGVASGSLGQYTDGQIRVGPGYSGAEFCYYYATGSLVDASGRGCVISGPTSQYQCDAGVTAQNAASGISIANNGSIEHNGNAVWYECYSTAAQGVYNVYASNPGSAGLDCHPITLTTANSNCSAPAVSASSAPASSRPVSSSAPASSAPASSSKPATSSAPASSAPASSSKPASSSAPATSAPATSAPATSAPATSAPATSPAAGASTSCLASTVTLPAPAASTVTVRAPASTSTVTLPAPAASTVTLPAPAASTVTLPAPAASTVTLPAPAASTVTLPAPAASTVTLPAPAAQTVTVANTVIPPYCSSLAPSRPATGPAAAGSTSVVTSTIARTSSVIVSNSRPASSSAPAASNSAPAPASSSKPATNSAPAPASSSKPATSAAPAPASSSKPASSAAPAPASSSAPAPAPASSSKPAASSCPTGIAGQNYQYPHLIVPVNKNSPNTAYGTQYFGGINSTFSSIYNFDIPQSYAGHTCSLEFLLPNKNQLVTSDYKFSGAGQIDFEMLASPASQSTTYNNQPKVAKDLGTYTITPGSSTIIVSGPCAAGQTVSYELVAKGDTALYYFQDYNPAALGLYIVSC